MVGQKKSFKKSIIIPFDLYTSLVGKKRGYTGQHTDSTTNWMAENDPVDYRMKIFDEKMAHDKKHKKLRNWSYSETTEPDSEKQQRPMEKTGSAVEQEQLSPVTQQTPISRLNLDSDDEISFQQSNDSPGPPFLTAEKGKRSYNLNIDKHRLLGTPDFDQDEGKGSTDEGAYGIQRGSTGWYSTRQTRKSSGKKEKSKKERKSKSKKQNTIELPDWTIRA